MPRSEDERPSALAVGAQWATRITSVGLEFVVPALLGALLDRWAGTTPLGTVLGAVLGFSVGMWHILRIAREGTAGRP